MRFLGDMGISPKTIEFLRAEGYDAVHLHLFALSLSKRKMYAGDKINYRKTLRIV